jgi:hypothetical protein
MEMTMNQTNSSLPRSRPLDDHKTWREELVLQLRMDDVPGDRIGEILLDIDQHIRDTGESPEEAFGPAKAYARSWRDSGEQARSSMLNLVAIAISAFAGTYLLTAGATGAGQGADSILRMPPVVALLMGAVILTVLVMQLPVDLIRHPATKQPLFGDSGRWRGITLAGLAVIAAGFYLIGRLLA